MTTTTARHAAPRLRDRIAPITDRLAAVFARVAAVVDRIVYAGVPAVPASRNGVVLGTQPRRFPVLPVQAATAPQPAIYETRLIRPELYDFLGIRNTPPAPVDELAA